MAASPPHRKSVLITGASQGIGRATALHLASRGYLVVATGRSLERLLKLKADSTDIAASNIIPWQLDVSAPGSAEQLPGILQRVGRLDVLVNNAGYGLRGCLEELDMGEVQAQFETNLFAVLRLSQAVLPHMRENGSGTIINIGSVSAHLGSPSSGAYAATKAALRSLTMVLRLEVQPFGIRVALIEPGVIKANFLRNQIVGEGAGGPGSPYASYAQKVEERSARFHYRGGDPLKVAGTVERIIRSRRPRPSYAVGLDAGLGVFAARFLPERLVQYCIRRVLTG